MQAGRNTTAVVLFVAAFVVCFGLFILGHHVAAYACLLAAWIITAWMLVRR